VSDDILSRLKSVEWALRKGEFSCGCKIGPVKSTIEHCGGHAYKSKTEIFWAHGVIESVIKDLQNEENE